MVLFIYNALIASATASRLYVAYSLFLLASLVTFLVSSRLTEQWGWLIDRHSSGYTALAFFAFSFWFMDELFKDKLTRLSRLCSWLGILLLLGHPVLPAPQMIQMMAGVTVPIIFVLLGTKIGSARRQGHRLAPYVALGWFLYIASNILTLLSAQGQLPPEFTSGYAVGNLLEGLVFSAVLALRLRQQDRVNRGLIHDLNKTLKHDNLTGLLNRTGIQDWLSQNAQQDLGLVLLDIDRFKSVNDTFSTQAGDRLLAQIALNLKNHVPTEGQIGRLGGDEFLIALPFISEEQLIHDTHQLVKTVQKSQIDYAGQSISRTASAGSIHLRFEHSLTQAITEANLALTNAKRSGGNQCAHFTSEFEEEMIRSGAYITDVQIEAALRAPEFKYFVQPIHRANLGGGI